MEMLLKNCKKKRKNPENVFLFLATGFEVAKKTKVIKMSFENIPKQNIISDQFQEQNI